MESLGDAIILLTPNNLPGFCEGLARERQQAAMQPTRQSGGGRMGSTHLTGDSWYSLNALNTVDDAIPAAVG